MLTSSSIMSKFQSSLVLFKDEASNEDEVIELLRIMKEDEALDIKDELTGDSLLMTSLDKNKLKVSSFLIEKGWLIEVVNKFKETPLMRSVERGHKEIAFLLIDHGCNLDAQEAGAGGGWTALYFSLHKGYLDISAKLMDKGCSLNLATTKGWTSLFKALNHGHLDIASRLIDEGANMNAQNSAGWTPLFKSLEKGHLTIAMKLIDLGCSLNLQDIDGVTSLIYSLDKGHLNIASKLLEKGCDLFLQTKDGENALHYASKKGQLSVLNEMLKMTDADGLGSLPDSFLCAKNTRNKTPLIKAKKESVVGTSAWPCEVCRIGFVDGDTIYCDVDGIAIYSDGTHFRIHVNCLVASVNSIGRTPLHVCLDDHTLYSLLGRGVSIERTDKDGNTPLHCSAMNNKLSVVKALLERGADWKALNKFKRTPLMMASPEATLDLLMTLVELDLPFTANGKELIFNSNHFFSLNKALDVALDLKLSRVTFIEHLIKVKFPHVSRLVIIKAIAFLKDENDREILYITDKETKDYFYSVLFFCRHYEIVLDGPPLYVSATAVVVRAVCHGLYKLAFIKASKDNNHTEASTYNPSVNSSSFEMSEAQFIKTIQNLGFLDSTNPTEAYENLKIDFAKWDESHNGSLNESEFVGFCNKSFGMSPPVVLKFMRNELEYLKEIEIRDKNDFSPEYVIGLVPSVTKDDFRRNVDHLVINEGRLEMKDYPYVLVLHSGDRSLDEIVSKERPKEDVAKKYLTDIIHALDHLYSKDIVHLDLKSLNVIRVQKRLILIDMDASSKIGGTALAKFSSGVLPPECFAILTNDEVKAFELYWKQEKDLNSNLWKKIQPRNNVVLKTYLESDNPTMNNGVTLPYALLKASVGIDLWSLGILIYKMFSTSSSSILFVNRDDDLVKTEDYKQAASWTKKQIYSIISRNITNSDVSDLLKKMLDPKLEDRLRHFQKDDDGENSDIYGEVLKHPFFSEDLKSMVKDTLNTVKKIDSTTSETNERTKAIDARTKMIQASVEKVLEMNVEIVSQISKTKDALLAGIYDATEVHIPTSFIIWTEDIAQVRDSNKGIVKKAMYDGQKCCSFLKGISEFGKSIREAGDPITAVQLSFNQFTKGEPLYFYLIDEATGEIVVPEDDPVYPIKIDTTNKKFGEFMEKNLPLIQNGFKLLSGLNKVASLLTTMGVPSLSSDSISGIGNMIDGFAKKSSVDDFGVVAGSISKTKEQVKQVRGARLRELERFFTLNDSDNTFCGLRRTYDGKTGKSIWTLKEVADEMEKKELSLSAPPPVVEENPFDARSGPPTSNYNNETEKDATIKSLSEKIRELEEVNQMLKGTNSNSSGSISVSTKEILTLMTKQQEHIEAYTLLMAKQTQMETQKAMEHLVLRVSSPTYPISPPHTNTSPLFLPRSEGIERSEVERKFEIIKSKLKDINKCIHWMNDKYEEVNITISSDLNHMIVYNADNEKNLIKIDVASIKDITKELTDKTVVTPRRSGIGLKMFSKKRNDSLCLFIYYLEEKEELLVLEMKSEKDKSLWFTRYKSLIDYVKEKK